MYQCMLSFKRPNLRLDSGHTIHIEHAKSPEELRTGLMFRRKLPINHGMLFHFHKPDHWIFWMKNTLIPLDIIWINQHKRVIYFLDHVPPCAKDTPCPLYKPLTIEKSKYVLEIAAGERQRLHIKLHQKLDF